MTYEVYIDRDVIRALKKLKEGDRGRIREAFLKLESFPHGLDVKKLYGTKNKYRIRVGRYRILVAIEGYKITVLAVLHRKHAYK